MRPVIALAGPTASGKTALSLRLARDLNGEVISADSMQIYRGMDIGTAKVTKEEMQGVPHHLLDIAEPGETVGAQQYQLLARRAVEDIRARGRLPIFCGGTGLFLHAALYPMAFTAAGEDAAFRREMEKLPMEELFRRLRQEDPVSAARIEPKNVKRVIRALEVKHLTGRPMSDFDQGELRPLDDLLFYGLTWPREELRRRIGVRVDTMLRDGLWGEVEGLLARGVPRESNAMQAIGYKQLAAALAGEMTRQEAEERVRIETCQYAKRQVSWFKREKDLLWLDAALGTDALAKRIEEEFYARIG